MVSSQINHRGIFDNSKYDGSCIKTIATCNNGNDQLFVIIDNFKLQNCICFSYILVMLCKFSKLRLKLSKLWYNPFNALRLLEKMIFIAAKYENEVNVRKINLGITNFRKIILAHVVVMRTMNSPSLAISMPYKCFHLRTPKMESTITILADYAPPSCLF